MALQLGPVIGQIGGGVEMFEPTFTPRTNGVRGPLATQVVGAGRWLVAVHINRYEFSVPKLWINNVMTLSDVSKNALFSTTAVVEGPTTITIEGLFISYGHVHIVRIG